MKRTRLQSDAPGRAGKVLSVWASAHDKPVVKKVHARVSFTYLEPRGVRWSPQVGYTNYIQES